MNIQNFNFSEAQSLSLLDEKFLVTLLEQQNRKIFAKIIALDINENPIDQIEGYVTGGTINIDGSSSVRRTCSLTMVSKNIDINDYYWGIKTKFKLEIGIQNNLQGNYAPTTSKYPFIVWFPQGYFLISSFNTSIATNSCTISLQGKDKMCLLNGDLGGQLFSSIDFGTEETISTLVEPVEIPTQTNSEKIMSKVLNQYYISEFASEVIKIDHGENLMTQPLYLFVLNENGNYYKTGKNVYSIINNAEGAASNKKYNIYKLIQSISDIFVRKTLTEEYVPSTFYYKNKNDNNNNNNEYYILDSREKSTTDRIYYKLRPFYQSLQGLEKKKIPIEKIIRESVHAYAREPYHNIIINDLDDYGLEQLTYKGEKTLYAFYKINTSEFTNLAFEDQLPSTCLSLFQTEGFEFCSLNENSFDIGTKIYLKNNDFNIPEEQDTDLDKFYAVARFTYGMDLGYRLTNLVYSGDLISNIGDSLTSILDKIKQMLGDFEYFYDIEGHFVFQRKKIYTETSWNQIMKTDNESYINPEKNKISFNFEGNRLISAIQNTPNLNNLRNDFVVWGKRKGISGQDLAIHARYAIDKKPVYYKSLDNNIYTTNINYAIEQGSISQKQYNNLEVTKKFTLNEEYLNHMVTDYGLTPPTYDVQHKTYTAGWWDIRDWAEYYKVLKNTDEDPNLTMKYYSSGDDKGCVAITTLLDEINSDVRMENLSYPSDGCVWLIEINKQTKKLRLSHGNKKYDPNQLTSCQCAKSVLLPDGSIKTTLTNETRNFPEPYAACNYSHTYQYFLNRTNEYDIYFYNPNFPEGNTEEIINEANDALYQTIEDDYNIHIVDWREIIYQMALDFFSGQGCSEENSVPLGNNQFMTDPDHFLYEVGQRNPYYYPTGYTGYEQYYTDMQGFWRQLYNPNYVPEPIYEDGHYINIVEQTNNTTTKKWIEKKIKDYNIEFYLNSEKELIKNQKQAIIDYIGNLNVDTTEYKLAQELLQKYNSFIKSPPKEQADGRVYWNKQVFEEPETLNFWIDFLDSETELAQFSVSSIGDRMKVVKEDKAGAIIYSTIPNFILYGSNNDLIPLTSETISGKSGFNFIHLSAKLNSLFTISYRSTSVKDKIDALLYEYGYCSESINLTAIPIYHLQPNTRIYVQDKDTNINGEYIVNRITLPLTYNGTMSITAIKAPERLY